MHETMGHRERKNGKLLFLTLTLLRGEKERRTIRLQWAERFNKKKNKMKNKTKKTTKKIQSETQVSIQPGYAQQSRAKQGSGQDEKEERRR